MRRNVLAVLVVAALVAVAVWLGREPDRVVVTSDAGVRSENAIASAATVPAMRLHGRVVDQDGAPVADVALTKYAPSIDTDSEPRTARRRPSPTPRQRPRTRCPLATTQPKASFGSISQGRVTIRGRQAESTREITVGNEPLDVEVTLE